MSIAVVQPTAKALLRSILSPVSEIIEIAAVAQGVERSGVVGILDPGRHGRAEGIVGIGRDQDFRGVQQTDDVALRVQQIVILRDSVAALRDHHVRLTAFVIDEPELSCRAGLVHDPAAERVEAVGGAADGLGAAHALHVVGIRRGRAALDCGCKLVALLPREGVVAAIIPIIRETRRRVRNGLRCAADLDLGQQVLPRRVLVIVCFCRSASGCAANIAGSVVGVVVSNGAAAALVHTLGELAHRVVGVSGGLGSVRRTCTRGRRNSADAV